MEGRASAMGVGGWVGPREVLDQAANWTYGSLVLKQQLKLNKRSRNNKNMRRQDTFVKGIMMNVPQLIAAHELRPCGYWAWPVH